MAEMWQKTPCSPPTILGEASQLQFTEITSMSEKQQKTRPHTYIEFGGSPKMRKNDKVDGKAWLTLVFYHQTSKVLHI